jgi:valyl-tRNA synthetase
MSKSKGNVIDPLIMMDKYGTDAFRFTLAAFAAQGRDIKFSEDRVEGYRHFVNKLWNAARFILLNAGEVSLPDEVDMRKLDIGSRWIVSRLSFTAEEVNQSLGDYRFNDAAGSIYHFVWHELCDWYIEMVKPVLYDESADKLPVKQCLLYVLERTLRLLHPFMPYVTEEVWQNMPHNGETIVKADYPANMPRDIEAEVHMSIIMEAVLGIRSIRGELNLSPGLELKAYVKTLNEKAQDVLSGNLAYLKKLAKVEVVKIGPDVMKIKGSSVAVRNHVEVYVPLEGLLNLDIEIDRLRKEEARIEESLIFLSKKLHSEDFMKRAPKDVIAKEQEKHEECLRKKERILENLRKLYEAKGEK